jgi:hypothetical protein
MLAILPIGILLISVFTAYMPYYIQPAEASFASIKNLSNTAGFSSDPQIAVSDNDVYVIWAEFTTSNNIQVKLADSTTGNWDIFFRSSNDNGATFSDTINLSNNAGESGRHRIAVSDNNVYVVWHHNGDIFFRSSNDNGATFSDTINLSNNPVSENTVDPNDNAGNETSTKRSDLPQIAVSDNDVYVIWANYIPGDYDIFFRSSNDNGATFSNAVNLETSFGLADLPQVAVSDNHVYVTWHDYSLAEGLDIFFRASNDNGATFGTAVSLIRNVGYTASSPLVVSSNNVYVVSAVGNIDIFFRASNDNGATFSSAISLSKGIEASSDPHMAVSGSNVYVVWEDYVTGNPDIFFTTFIPSIDSQAEEKMVLLTDNGSIKVEVAMDREMIETEQPVRFTLRFLHPLTEEPLEHVNYSFTIMDEKGNNMVSESNIHAHLGIDTQSVTFSETGSFTMSIDVTGIGVEEPYDSSYSGEVSTALVVVPEFPLGILAVMGVVLGTAIAITRFRK